MSGFQQKIIRHAKRPKKKKKKKTSWKSLSKHQKADLDMAEMLELSDQELKITLIKGYNRKSEQHAR